MVPAKLATTRGRELPEWRPKPTSRTPGDAELALRLGIMLPSRRILDDRGNERRYIAAAHPDEDARLAARAFERKREEAARMGPPREGSGVPWHAALTGYVRGLRLPRVPGVPSSVAAVLKAIGGFVFGLVAFVVILVASAAAFGLMLVFLVLCGVVVFLPVASSHLAAAFAVAACSAMVVAVLAPRRLGVRMGPPRSGFAHLSARLRRGACPCCAYDYGEAPVEPDGCRVCSECGAAWRPASEDGEADEENEAEHEYVDADGRSLRDIEETEGCSGLPDYGPPRPSTVCEVLDLLGNPRNILPQRVPQPQPLGVLGTFPSARWLLLLMFVACAASIAAARGLSLAPARSGVFLPGSCVVSLCLALFAARRVVRYESAARQARVWLEARSCLACESPLTEASGCLRCPACGAAWAKPGAR